MYLEISARQTGKTTRLIKHIQEMLDTGHVVALCSHNGRWDHHIRRMINIPKSGVFFTFRTLERLYESLEGRNIDRNNIHFVYDEFDLIKSKNIEVDREGYYVTTPKFTRTTEYIKNWYDNGKNLVDDPLLTLLHYNNGCSVNYNANSLLFGSGDEDKLDSLYYTLQPEQLNTEYNNQFIDISNRYDDETWRFMGRIHLNPKLLVKQEVSEINRDKIRYLHVKVYRLFDKMQKLNPNSNDFYHQLKWYANTLEEIEFKMQELWGFPRDRDMHTHWIGMPWCKCPDMDNRDRIGTKEYIFNTTCPIHGRG